MLTLAKNKQINKWFLGNDTWLTSPVHSRTTRCWDSELCLTLEKNKSCLRDQGRSPEPHSLRRMVWAVGRRSREGRKKKQQEVDTGVNPLGVAVTLIYLSSGSGELFAGLAQ